MAAHFRRLQAFLLMPIIRYGHADALANSSLFPELWNASAVLRRLKRSEITTSRCVVNTFATATYLWECGNVVASSTVSCEDEDKNLCVVDVFGIVQSFLSSAAYIAQIVDLCAPVANSDAACSADIICLLSSIAQAGQAIAGLKTVCNEAVLFPKRRLAVDEDKLMMSWCTVSGVSAPIYLAQAANNLYNAVGDCPADQKAACTADVSAVIGGLANVAAYIAPMASVCAKTINIRADCTSAAATLVNSLAGIANCAAGIVGDCPKPPTKFDRPHPTVASVSDDDGEPAFPNETDFLSPSEIIVR